MSPWRALCPSPNARRVRFRIFRRSGRPCRLFGRPSPPRSSRSGTIESEVALPEGAFYLDTSALVKLYVPESDSESLNHALKGRHDAIISELAITEIASAIARRKRKGSLDGKSALRIYRRLLDDAESNIYARVELLPAAHREAERILLSSASGLRAADALHISLALLSAARTIVTFDERMSDAARTLGLHTFPHTRKATRVNR